MTRLASLAPIALAAVLAGCRTPPAAIEPPDAAASPPAPASAPPASAPSTSAPPRASPAHVAHPGSAIARAPHEDALYVADEDHDSLQRVTLPAGPAAEVKLPGPPAQLVALDDRVVVTVRGLSGDPSTPLRAPGLLMTFQADVARGLVETARVELPADAWGLAVTADERIVVVTSAWTHQVSAVDLAAGKLLWSVDVGREPRGVAIRADGAGAYVTHLVRAGLTRIDDLAGPPRVRAVPFPAAPIRTIPQRADAATLGYAPVLSPDGARLYLARQALGATGRFTWAGQATMDVLLTEDEAPLAGRPKRWYVMEAPDFLRGWEWNRPRSYGVTGPTPIQTVTDLAQPRAAVYRSATDTILVASEGNDSLVEVDALAVDPSIVPLRVYGLRRAPDHEGSPGNVIDVALCGAPSGVALSADEATAYVFCRSTHEVAVVPLDPFDPAYKYVQEVPQHIALGPDPLPAQAALGRQLFYRAMDASMSDGLACSGCHPEGRDDGHVWREDAADPPAMHAFEIEALDEERKGRPRQTPMLVSRVGAFGPYGWKAESKTLRNRIVVGFYIHRWSSWVSPETLNERADAIGEFLRTGLVPPPREVRDPTPEEARGKVVFNDPNVGCAECHTPKSGYTNRARVGLGEWAIDKSREDPEPDDWSFKVPSLLFVGGSPPYYHDGSEATLEDLVAHNGTRMGHTKELSPADRAALVAFLRTL
jgi:DNA-binding beta-propeller fold protein YncE